MHGQALGLALRISLLKMGQSAMVFGMMDLTCHNANLNGFRWTAWRYFGRWLLVVGFSSSTTKNIFNCSIYPHRHMQVTRRISNARFLSI